jgi:hypothetical protein
MEVLELSGDRAIFIAVDAKSYSGVVASEQAGIQHDLRAIIDRAARDARLPIDRWIDQPQGDGALFLAPLDGEPRYVDDLIAHLQAHLGRRNRDRLADARLRIRVGLDQGPTTVAANGFTGEAPILACRLRDAPITKAALVESGADLVLALSPVMFMDNVEQDRTRVNRSEFIKVEIDEEKVFTTAWLWLPPGRSSQTLEEARAGKRRIGPGGARTSNENADNAPQPSAAGGYALPQPTIATGNITGSNVSFGPSSPVIRIGQTGSDDESS